MTILRLSLLELGVAEGVASLQLNRPPMNPVNDDLLHQLDEALAFVEESAAIVLRLRGNDRAFCAGADLKLVAQRVGDSSGADAMQETSKLFQRVYRRLERLPALTIAEIAGLALGGGLELALACDVRAVAEGATLGLPEVKVGLLPGAGGTQRLTQLCGRGAAARLILSGELVTAREAHRIGLADYLAASPADLDALIQEIVGRTIAHSWPAIREAKSCIEAAVDIAPFGFDRESAGIRSLMLTEEAVARVTRFANSPPTGAG